MIDRNIDLAVLFFIFYFFFTTADDNNFDDGSCTTCPHSIFTFNRVGAEIRIQTLINEAAQCIECNLLLQAVNHFKPGWIDANKHSRCRIYLEKGKTYTVKLLPRRKARIPIASFQFMHRSRNEPFYEPEDPASFSEDVLRRPRAQALEVIPDSSSKAALGRASQWLSHCLEHNQACELPNPGFMPRLLIDVGPQDSPRGPFLYKPLEVTPYACLSYCWGSDTSGVLWTTLENLESHRESIPFSKLPLTIQDAITVCRGLKIPSLWVDSLCIIQDDPVAWLEEAAQMDRIYLHSRLTIVALEPATCKSPFLGPQKFAHPAWQSRFTADIPLEENEPPLEIFVRPWRGDDFEGNEDVITSSLDKRGWCLQESLLPTRRLCFNGDEMIWQCLCRTICECGHILWKAQPAGFGRLGTHIKLSRLKGEVILSHPQPARSAYESYHNYDYARRGLGYPQTAYRRWRDIVMEYTKRNLTFQKDKLSAISGLAKLVREGLPSDQQGQEVEYPEVYLAGLWRGEFHYDLAWVVGSPAQERITETSLGIPSWSWASVDVPVTYKFDAPIDIWKYHPNLIECVKVSRVSCERELASEETSNVLSGEAVLTGLASRVELAVVRGSEGYDEAFVRSENLYAYEVQLDRPRSLTVFSKGRQKECWRKGKCQYGNDCCNWKIDGLDEKLMCLVLFSWTAPVDKVDDDGNPFPNMGPETWFLVLKESNAVEGAFERIGIGRYFHRMSQKCKLFANEEYATIKIV
ncbi:heterokaryon incompatibility protein domain-containing protein [Trichoderma chlorosporum]